MSRRGSQAPGAAPVVSLRKGKGGGRKAKGMEGGRERWRGDRREEQGMGGGREAEKEGGYTLIPFGQELPLSLGDRVNSSNFLKGFRGPKDPLFYDTPEK